MSKPTIQSIHVKLEKHVAVSDERWVETILRIKRLESIMIGSAGAIILLLLAVVYRG
ncbi:MAG: hypothetical protein ACPHHR_10245 [Cycloclasticus sp.]